jgi:hypothetical protein
MKNCSSIKFFIIRLDFLIRVQTSEKEKLESKSNLYELMYRDAQAIANTFEKGGQTDQRTSEIPH